MGGGVVYRTSSHVIGWFERVNSYLIGWHLLLRVVISLLLSARVRWCVNAVGQSAPALSDRWREMKLPGVCLAHAYSFVTKSSLCLLYFYRKSNFVFRNLITRRQISCIFTNYFRLRWRTTEASQEEESGVHGVGFDLTSSFLKILIYIFFLRFTC